MIKLPESGSVIGLDVGCSPKRRSSAICRLDWTPDRVDWSIQRFRAVPEERHAAIIGMADRPLLAAALDGPLQAGFTQIGRYRHAERMLTLGFQPQIGKPGQSSTPVGKMLNDHANLCAIDLAATSMIGAAGHAEAIDKLAIVEAFPSSFMGMLIDDPVRLAARRSDRSDTFFSYLAGNGGLERVLTHALPNRQTAKAPDSVTNHDDRAAFICALTALSVVSGDYVAVGDSLGWIILPSANLIPDWAIGQLELNATKIGGGLNMVGR